MWPGTLGGLGCGGDSISQEQAQGWQWMAVMLPMALSHWDTAGSPWGHAQGHQLG